MENTIDTTMKSEGQTSEEHIEVDRWDRLGMILSAICAIHCLLTPVLMLTLPFAAEKFENPLVHIILALLVVPVGSYAFLSGYKHHQNKHILMWGLFGVFVVGGMSIAPIISEHLHDFEIPVMVMGSLVLLAAHYRNRKSCECPH